MGLCTVCVMSFPFIVRPPKRLPYGRIFPVAQFCIRDTFRCMSDVNVIGNGIVGLCSAHSLLRRGKRVRIFGAESPIGAASWGCAGHLAVEQCDPLASWNSIRALPRRLYQFGGAASFPAAQVTKWLPFAIRFLAAANRTRFECGRAALTELLARSMGSWLARLSAIGAPDLLANKGHLVCWDSVRSARSGIAAWQSSKPPFITLSAPDQEDLRLLESLGVTPGNAIRFAGSGHITDLHGLRDRLRSAIVDLGGEFVETLVAPTDLAQFGRASVLVAAGWDSRRLLRHWELDAPLISERGYHVEIDVPENFPDVAPVVFESQSLIMTRFERSLRFASFVEFGDGLSAPDPSKWAVLENRINALGFDLKSARRWHGSRPTLPDYLPAIGRIPGTENAFCAFGHQHLGLTLGSITGELIAGLMTGDSLPIDLDRFALARFDTRSVVRPKTGN